MYGAAEASRQCASTFEDRLLNMCEGSNGNGIGEMYSRQAQNGAIPSVIAKTTDDILMTGPVTDMQCFMVTVKKTFMLSKDFIDPNIEFNGTVVARSELGFIKMQ